jgi:hypothetical protein
LASSPLLRDRVEAVERLAQLFRLERFIYLGVTAISFLSAQLAEWGLLFGSSGLITITGNRVLQMWSQALRMVASEPVDGKSAEAKHE